MLPRYPARDDAFYHELIAHSLQKPLPPLPRDVRTQEDYALARMRMLGRKAQGPLTVPLDPTLREALRLALAAAQNGITPRARRHRRMLAARAALAIGKDVPLMRREAYLREYAAVAGCIARLFEE